MFKFKDGIKRRNLKRRLKDIDNSTEVKEKNGTFDTSSPDEIEKHSGQSQLPTKNYRNIAPKQFDQANNSIEIGLPTMVPPSAFKLEIVADDSVQTSTLSEKLLATIPPTEGTIEPGFPNSIYIESTSYKMSEEARNMILEHVLWSNQRILPNPSKKANRTK